MLIRNLPADSALSRAVHGNERVEWTPTIELLATIVDALNAAAFQRAGGKGKRPTPVPRPGADRTVRIGGTTRSPADVRALLDSYSYRPEETSENERN